MSISKLLKSVVAAKGTDDPATLQATIAKLEAEKSAAQAEMARIAARRPELLLEDRDADLDKDERASERAYRVVEKVDASLPSLRERLRAALAVDRDKRFAAKLAELQSIVATVANLAPRLQAEFKKYLSISAELRAIDADRAIAACPPPPILASGAPVLADDLLASWLEATSASTRLKPAPAVAAPTKPIAAPPKTAKPIPKAERQRIVEPAGPGQVQARVQRSGYEANGRQYAQGDIIALAAETARQAIQNGPLDGVAQ